MPGILQMSIFSGSGSFSGSITCLLAHEREQDLTWYDLGLRTSVFATLLCGRLAEGFLGARDPPRH